VLASSWFVGGQCALATNTAQCWDQAKCVGRQHCCRPRQVSFSCIGCKIACKVRRQQQLQQFHSCMTANSNKHRDPRANCARARQPGATAKQLFIIRRRQGIGHTCHIGSMNWATACTPATSSTIGGPITVLNARLAAVAKLRPRSSSCLPHCSRPDPNKTRGDPSPRRWAACERQTISTFKQGN